MLTIAEIRRLAEERNQRICREYYEHGSGLKPDMAMAPIMEAYGDLHSREVIDRLREAARTEEEPTERRRLEYLLADLLEGYLSNRVAALHDRAATMEATWRIVFQGEELPFRQAAIRMANEGDRSRRMSLQALSRQVIAELTPLHAEALSRTRDLIARELGFASCVDFYRQQRGIDFPALGELMRRFLERTEALYVDTMERWTRDALGLALHECERHDITYLLRAREFDHAFPESGLIPTLEATVRDLGLSLDHISLDLEKRPTKSPRAFCSPVRIPQEIYLVVSPKGGSDDYAALLHECGHSLHFAHVAPDLPYEFRYLGDNSVTETFAFTFEHLALEPGWLARHTALSESEIARYRYHGFRQLLFMVRRYCAKLLYELELHDSRPLEGKAKLYRQHLEAALKYRHFEEYWLFDTDDGFYSAQYLRAWILSAQLRAYLRRRHGERYYLKPEAGADLAGLWRIGQQLPAHELVSYLDTDGLDIEALVGDITSVLGGVETAR